MRWNHWLMLGLAGFAPSLSRAADSAERAPERVRITVNRDGEGEPRVIVLREEGDEKPGPDVAEKLQEELQRQLRDFERQRGQFNRAIALERKKEKGAYLGVSATPPPAVLRKQLGLAEGMGLVVNVVVPDSPAGKAGVKQYDVLQKFEDQLIINQEQLAVLVRSHKPGDEIKLTVIHDGKPVALTAKLTEHELEPLAEQGNGPNIEIADEAIRRMLPEPRVHPIQPGDRAMKFWIDGVNISNNGPSSVTLIDNDHSYSITTDSSGKKTLIAKDKDGKETFNGPVNTPEEREKLSAELKAKLQSIEKLTPKLDKHPNNWKWSPEPRGNPTTKKSGDSEGEKK